MPQFGYTTTTDEVLEGVDLTGKRFLVTGTSAGLGVETARALVAHGADVVGTVRDLAKGEKATAAVREAAAASGGSFALVQCDLADLASIRAAADALNAKGDLFDAVIANAGVMAPPFGRTRDGFETQFGTNHLGHFLLVNRIEKLIRDGGRLVNLSSAGHRRSPVNLDDPNFDRTEYDSWVGYGRSKTANVLFAVEFDRRHKHRGVRAVAIHPGGILTELDRHLGDGVIEAMKDGVQQQMEEHGMTGTFQWKTIPQGAATSVWAAVVAPADEIGGHYAEDCHVSPVVPEDKPLFMLIPGVRPYAVDPEIAKALWAKSEELVGERF